MRSEKESLLEQKKFKHYVIVLHSLLIVPLISFFLTLNFPTLLLLCNTRHHFLQSHMIFLLNIC